jgi:hypothetical protein
VLRNYVGLTAFKLSRGFAVRLFSAFIAHHALPAVRSGPCRFDCCVSTSRPTCKRKRPRLQVGAVSGEKHEVGVRTDLALS